MEQIYNDFTTKLLPKIQEGLVITKDYFSELFTRYVNFLFIVDVLSAILFILGAIALYFFIKRMHKLSKEDGYDTPGYILGVIFGSTAIVLFIGFSINSIINAIKDKYVPEIRVIEKIQSFKNQ